MLFFITKQKMANATCTCSDKDLNESSTLCDSDSSDPNEQQDSSVCAGNNETPLKKRKRMCRYRSEWSGEFTWCKNVRANIFAAECTICQKTFSIAHGGRSDLVKHSLKSCHKTAARAAHASAIQSYFVKATPTGIDRQVCVTVFDFSAKTPWNAVKGRPKLCHPLCACLSSVCHSVVSVCDVLFCGLMLPLGTVTLQRGLRPNTKGLTLHLQ